jgi:hypothetical protein
MKLNLNYDVCGTLKTHGKQKINSVLLDFSMHKDVLVACCYTAPITAAEAIAFSIKGGRNKPTIRSPQNGVWGKDLPKQEMKRTITTRNPNTHKNVVFLSSVHLNDVTHDTQTFFYSYDQEINEVELTELVRHKYPVLDSKYASKFMEVMREDGRITTCVGTLNIIAVDIDDLHGVISKVIKCTFA